MKKHFFTALIALAYVVAYCDWLQPGFLSFGLPAAWNRPLSTATTYDLTASVRRSAKCAALETIPNWAKPNNWRIGPRTQAPKTCQQRLREAEESP